MPVFSHPFRLVCALICAGALLPAASMAAEGGPAGGMRQPIGPGSMPPAGGIGGPLGTPPVNGMVRPGAIRPDADPSGMFSSTVRSPADERERRAAFISYRGTQYVVSDGQWYEQRGRRLVSVDAPTGMMVRDLPGGYQMRWIEGVPYFFADGVYYVWREGVRRYEILPTAPAPAAATTRADKPAATPAVPEK